MDKAKVAEERRSQILEAALRCFAHQGYHQTTMDDIVEESGLSKGTLYWYYESKKEIFLSVTENWSPSWRTGLGGGGNPYKGVSPHKTPRLRSCANLTRL